jgi:hypothetical protein
MNIARVKALVWGASAVIGAGLVVYVGQFFRNRQDYLQPVARERMQGVLENVREVAQRTEDIVDSKLIERAKGYDWTGAPDAEKPVQVDDKPTAPVAEHVTDLLKVQMAVYDTLEPDLSYLILKYTSQARVTLSKGRPALDGTTLKRVGDVLDDRLSNIQIFQIDPEGVVFKFLDDPSRADERVTPKEYEWRAYYTSVEGDEFVIRPQRTISDVAFQQNPVTPGRTEQLSPTKYRLGDEDLRYFDENYPKILTEEVEVSDHRDRSTGKRDGIQVNRIAPDSIAARHGVVEGDVIKSINGHPVTSKDEAILFVKNNQKKYTEWVVEIWNKGQTRTLTYYSNQKK